MSFEHTKWVWMNGECIPWDQANVHVSVHALHYGTGVFEGIRCYETAVGPAVFRLDAHIARLRNSASVYGMEIPFNLEELAEAVCEIVRRNGFRNCYIRPLCFFGSHNLSLNPSQCPVAVVIFAWPWDTLLGSAATVEGVRVTVSPWVKFHPRMIPTSAKACGQYLNSVLAVRDALQRGYDEALLLDADGLIAEGPGENLFIVRNRRVRTNEAHDSILPGITRDAVLRIARDLGYELKCEPLGVEDLLEADEAFFTGTAAEVTPIREVDGKPIGNGRPGPVTQKIQEAFGAAIEGRDGRYRDWLHFVAQPVGLSL